MPDAPLSIAAEVVAELLGCDLSLLVNPPYHDEARLRTDLEEAQFQQINIERIRQPAVAASAREADKSHGCRQTGNLRLVREKVPIDHQLGTGD